VNENDGLRHERGLALPAMKKCMKHGEVLSRLAGACRMFVSPAIPGGCAQRRRNVGKRNSIAVTIPPSMPARRAAHSKTNFWRFSFGADEPNYAYMEAGQEAPRRNSVETGPGRGLFSRAA